MSQRYMCPSVGTVGRSLRQRTVRCSRSFHASARRLENQSDNSAPTLSLKDAMTAQRQPRRERNANAAAQIGDLQIRRLPFGRSDTSGSDTKPSTGLRGIAPRTPFNRNQASSTPGTMVRAPSTLKISRTPGPPGGRPSGGPNLRARGGGPPGASRGPSKNRGGEGNRPKPRRGGGGRGQSPIFNPDSVEAEGLDNATMSALFRMQRNMWDRKKYEPKYATGSLEANQLIHVGRELFKGEAPPVKIWGRAEKTLGVVGMHGAAAHLQVRRVPDGDDKPFGEEEENLLSLKQDTTPEEKLVITVA